MKKTVFICLVMCNIAACQDNNILNKYREANCNYDKYDAALLSEISGVLKDTIAINSYNDFIGQNKIYRYRNDQKKTYSSIGKVSTSNTSKYNRIVPLCKVQYANYTNIYTLHYSFDQGRIELIVLDKNNQVFSGLVLLKGEMNYSDKKILFEQITTKVEDRVYVQERIIETPEGDKFVKKYRQRDDGYIEDITNN